MIRACTCVLANLWKMGWGSAMELLYAWEHGKPVFAVSAEPVHPWIRYHCAFTFPHIDDALEAALNYCQDHYASRPWIIQPPPKGLPEEIGHDASPLWESEDFRQQSANEI